MHVRKGLGVLGLGVASGAVLAVPSVANAAPGASHTYNSTSSAKAGVIAVAGNSPTGGGTANATDSNGPQGSTVPLLQAINLPGGLGTVSGVDVISTNAQASATGLSAACSALASAGCVHAGHTAAPIFVHLSLAQLAKSAPSLPIGVPPIDGTEVVLGITGLSAACKAGPSGGPASNFGASSSGLSVTVDIRNGGKSVIGGPKTLGGSGNPLSAVTSPTLAPLLTALNGAVQVTMDPGSFSGSGPKTAATAGRVAVAVGGNKVVSLDGGSVTCGPNQAAPTTNTSGSNPVGNGNGNGNGGSTGPGSSSVGTGTTSGMTSSSSGETPLTSVQTDEGRWTPASNETPLWAGLAVGGLALTGGFTLWRRRLSRS